jgi:hypothetical protein
MNPLLEFEGLPRFDEIRPEHVAAAIDELLAAGRRAIASSLQAPATWSGFVAPLEDANERLGRAWGQVAHLHVVMDDPALREAYNAALPKISQYWTELGQNLQLYQKYKELGRSADFASLSPPRKKIVENALRDFRLGGAELPLEKKQRYADIQEELARLSAKFSENVLDATNAFSIVIEDQQRLSGIPADVLQAARESAEKEGKRGWKFTLHMPSYLPVMQYAEERSLRETLYRESATRAAEFGKREWDNTPHIARIVELRRELAAVLGYANYAEVSLEPKMAQSPAQVIEFLDDLARHARPFAEKDAAELRAFARSDLGIEELQAWDVPYASEKLRAKRYAFSEAVLPGGRGAAGPVPRGAGALPDRHCALQGPGVARGRALFRDPRRCGRSRRAFLHGSLRARHQARRRLDGRRDRPAAQGHRDPDPGGTPQLQFLEGDRRQARALHARRGAHAVPRVRARPAPSAHARGGPRGLGHQRRRVGCGRASQPVHGELRLGMGRVAAHDPSRRYWLSHSRNLVRADDCSKEFPERARDAAPDRVRRVRHAPALGV